MQARTPKLKALNGACDTHTHFYNSRFPTAPTALTTPPDAWVDEYKKIQQRLGTQRVVMVQPTTYGLDNRCQLEAAGAFGENARCVIVADTTTTDAEMEAFHRQGVRGVRFHMLPGGAVGWAILPDMAAMTANFDWHVQLQMNGRDLPEKAGMLKGLPGKLVVDHVGRFMDPVPLDNAAFKVLLDLVDAGRCWVKLSAPYESSRSGPPQWKDVRPLARKLVQAAPERMLWASNWPHPGQENPPDEADLMDLLLDWVDDEVVRKRILVDNPAALYDF